MSGGGPAGEDPVGGDRMRGADPASGDGKVRRRDEERDGPATAATGWRVRARALGPEGGPETIWTSVTSNPAPPPEVLVSGEARPVRLDRRDPTRAVLVEGDGPDPWRIPILFGPASSGPDGILRRELVVDGWRVEVEVEQESRAALRDRARATGVAAAGGGRGEVRAIIPGKIVAIDVQAGATVEPGQRLLVLEAMKMQNEIVAPRGGTVERIAVEPGATVERDDLLVVIR